MFQVTYLYHSGFLIELDQHVLIFDYYKGQIPPIADHKKVLVFVSHKHQDHFNMDILKLKAGVSQRFFVGSEVKLNETDFSIDTLRSTDEGVAFIIEIEGKRIYHGGDLNHWYWKEESNQWNQQMKQDYETEINKITGQFFDVAFVPLDPRLEKGYCYGLDYFLQKVEVSYLFPMHMWDQYEMIDRYKKTEKGRKYTGMIMEISDTNTEFVLE